MADESLIGRIHDLSDLELAVLICLVAKEHCIIDTEPDALGELVEELELVRIPGDLIVSQLMRHTGSGKCLWINPCDRRLLGAYLSRRLRTCYYLRRDQLEPGQLPSENETRTLLRFQHTHLPIGL
jgi:hypothetical protein